MNKDSLFVFYEDKLVGHLRRSTFGKVKFSYADEWLNSDGAFRISVSLPLIYEDEETEEFEEYTSLFFGNLLPEDHHRMVIEGRYGITKNDDFELFKKIGIDCAGALTVSKEPISLEQNYKKINDNDIWKLFDERDYFDLLEDFGEGIRWSLAGAQQKIGIAMFDGDFYLPIDNAPSTHILKFESQKMHHATQFEYLTTKTARKIGLNVPDIFFYEFNNKTITLSQRYDRKEKNGVINRLHQEDFCQALSTSNAHKYEIDGEVDLERIKTIIEENSYKNITDRKALVEWQVFNFIIGNSDGHAKNLSLIYDYGKDKVSLAPFYDFICTEAYSKINKEMALSINNKRIREDITKDDWIKFAKILGVKPFLVQSIINKQCLDIPDQFNKERQKFEEKFGPYKPFDKIKNIIDKNVCLIKKVFEPKNTPDNEISI